MSVKRGSTVYMYKNQLQDSRKSTWPVVLQERCEEMAHPAHPRSGRAPRRCPPRLTSRSSWEGVEVAPPPDPSLWGGRRGKRIKAGS